MRLPAEQHRQVDAPTIALAIVDQAGTGQRGNDHGCSFQLAGQERGGGARLVMVLDGAHERALVGHVPREMPAHAPRAVMDEPIVEALVVAVVEALLLELPFEFPVRLRHEAEPRLVSLDSRNDLAPELAL